MANTVSDLMLRRLGEWADVAAAHITVSQATRYAKALAKGDPNAGAIVWHTFERSVFG